MKNTNLSKSQDKQISKYLSYILRHQPESIALKLDHEGWANLQHLILQSKNIGNMQLDLATIYAVVESNDKQRFQISADGLNIRAVQGHSNINVDLNFVVKQPPDLLYHGTATRFIESIMAKGLIPMQRQYVHLSEQQHTAVQVGQRYGKVVILKIDSQQMHAQGFQFFQAKNGVWLTRHVPIAFIDGYEVD